MKNTDTQKFNQRLSTLFRAGKNYFTPLPCRKEYRNPSKAEKIFLQNTTLLLALAKESANSGSVRETFFHSMVSPKHQLEAPKKGNSFVDGQYTLEIGGSTKKKQQVKLTPNSWVVKDGIETGTNEILPLWAFGFLY